MILAPSDIHFLQDMNNGLLTPDEGTMADLSNRFLQGHERIPKVQVAEKNGFWFALNNSYLHIIKDLEKQGKCAKIRVEVVPLSKVPETLQKGMIVEGDRTRQSTDDKMCYRLNHGYCRIPPTCLATNAHLANLDDDTDDTSSYTSSDYSDYDNDDEDDVSGSEYDDDLSCNVCDRSFSSTRLLAQHQQKKRHFGCSVCNSCFPSLHALEHHKESLDHWSEDDGNTYESDSCCDDSDDDRQPVAASVEQKDQPKKSEEMERLL